MADEWDDCASTGKSFGRGNYIGDPTTESSSKEIDGWTDNSGWGDNIDSTTFGNDDGDSSDRNGYGGRGGRGGGGRGRGRGGGGFRGSRGGGRGRDGGDRRGGYDGGDRRGGDDNQNGWGDDNQFGEGDNDKQNTEKPREFYIPPDPTEDEDEIFQSGISSGINFNKYDKIPVNVTPGAPPAISTFRESGLRDFVLDNIKKSGYTVPTPIQKNAIPIIMAKRDLMACAQTGSGKTAAFLLPIINDLLANNVDMHIGRPQVLIVSPTRELSIQIFNEARKFSLGSYLKISIVYGGTAVKHQGDNVAKGCHILVCTPGRLIDFVDRGYISFEDTRFVVLDEADRMLDMGFMPAVEKIMNHPTMRAVEDRQNLMFSATFPEEIQRLAGQFLNNYIFLAIGIVGGACSDVEQNFFKVTKFEKRAKLTDIFEQEDPAGTMVFVETKRNADFLASLLSETKFPTTSIHGDRLQREREQALKDFKTGKMSVLIATSVAARGLDIKNVAHVINYDLPKSIDEYVHRIGRTGRVGNCGKATSFYDPDQDSELATHLVKILKQADKPVPDFLLAAEAGGGGGGYRGGSNRFGGRDVRNKGNLEINDFGRACAISEPQSQEPLEEW